MSGNSPAGSEKKKGKKWLTVKNKFKEITGIPLELQRPLPTGNRSAKEVDEMEIVYKKVYQLGHPACQNFSHRTGNCRNNPKCIKGLGEETEGLWKAEKELGSSPEESLRPLGSPYIGLRNLGATCYINSLLQSLFMNRNFRSAVYQWQGDDKLCKSLQLLFSKLQNSKKNYCSPKEITDLLNIQTSVHQDVQEFNNLFMSCLNSKFKKCDIPFVKDFIDQEFKGINQYQTKCKRCGNTSARDSAFNELELTIPYDKGTVSLNSCMKALVKEETLCDDNKYDCENCGLVDAVRRLRLVKLPPVLNIQLLRFVYDASTGTKKKLSTMVSFPRTLDLSNFIELEKSECTYHLSAVLLHLGASASAGHYIAHIHDEATKQWWKFDDSSVTPLDSKEVGDIEPTVTFESQGTREKAKSIISGLKKNPKVTSANAYMLIYTRKDTHKISADPVPPPELAQHVEKMNSILMQKLKEWEEQKKEILAAISSHRAAYNEFIKLAPLSNRHQYNWIDSRWLASWISGDSPGPIDNSNIMCSHDCVDPKKLPYLKTIDPKAWTYLSDNVGGGGPILNDANLCFECAAAIFESNALQQGRKNEVQRMIRLAYTSTALHDGYWVPESWLKGWKECAMSGDLSSLESQICRSITCEHDALTWKKQNRRVVSTEVWSYLRSSFPHGPEYPKNTEACIICREEAEFRIAQAKERREIRVQQKYKLPSLFKSPYYRDMVTGTYYVVPISWQKEWYHYISRPDVEKLLPPNLSCLLCEHNKLKYDPVELIDYCINAVVATRVVKEEEWENIKKFYGDPGLSIRLNIVRSKDTLEKSSSPEYCNECMAVQKLQDIEDQMNYSSAKIWIEIPGSSSISAVLNPFGSKSTQLSRFGLEVDISDTIHVLKLKIMRRTNIEPINQQLSFRGEILENGKTVYDHKLIPGARVVLQRVKGKEGYEDGESNTVVAPPPEPLRPSQINYTAVEQGFAGSLLIDEDDDGDQTKQEEPEPEWNCSSCTMINTGTSCSLCEMPNPAIFGQDATVREEPLWVCTYCKIENEQVNNRCIACEKRRQ